MPIVVVHFSNFIFIAKRKQPRGTRNIIIYPPKQEKSKNLYTQQKELNEMKNRKRKQPQKAMMMMRGCLIFNGNRKCS